MRAPSILIWPQVIAMRVLFLLLVFSLPGQSRPERAIVASRLTGTPATALLDVDLNTGKARRLARFPSDSRPPLALLVDPVDRDVLLALDLNGATGIVRLRFRGAALVSERVLTVVQGKVTGMVMANADEILMTVGGAGGGLFTAPRHGGATRRVVTLPRASALFGKRCPPATGMWIAPSRGGPPRLGNAFFRLDLFGAPASRPVTLLLGVSDQRFASARLPFLMPGGCLLHVSAEVLLPSVASGSGFASRLLPIPNTLSLTGGIFYGQWVGAGPNGLRASDAAALHVFS